MVIEAIRPPARVGFGGSRGGVSFGGRARPESLRSTRPAGALPAPSYGLAGYDVVIARAPRAPVFVALALLASVVLAPPASGSANDVIRDCSEDGELNGHYSHGELAKALDKLPSDLDEYTDCRAVIRSAELRSANKRKGGPGGAAGVDTASAPSADEQRKIAQAAKSAAPVNIGGKAIRPGFRAAGVGTDLPTLVLVLLIALAGGVAASAALAIRRHGLANALRDGIARLRR
jgi:hypothetical protein